MVMASLLFAVTIVITDAATYTDCPSGTTGSCRDITASYGSGNITCPATTRHCYCTPTYDADDGGYCFAYSTIGGHQGPTVYDYDDWGVVYHSANCYGSYYASNGQYVSGKDPISEAWYQYKPSCHCTTKHTTKLSCRVTITTCWKFDTYYPDYEVSYYSEIYPYYSTSVYGYGTGSDIKSAEEDALQDLISDTDGRCFVPTAYPTRSPTPPTPRPTYRPTPYPTEPTPEPTYWRYETTADTSDGGSGFDIAEFIQKRWYIPAGIVLLVCGCCILRCMCCGNAGSKSKNAEGYSQMQEVEVDEFEDGYGNSNMNVINGNNNKVNINNNNQRYVGSNVTNIYMNN